MEKTKQYLHAHLGYLAFVPFLLVALCYELLPLADLLLSSLLEKQSGLPGFGNFIKVFTTPLYQQSILNSARISVISAVIGLAVAFCAAQCCASAGAKMRGAFTMILNMTSNFAGVPLAFAFMVLMGNTGVLTLLGQRFGLPLLGDFELYSGQGLVVTYIYFQIPLATLLLLPSLKGIRPEWREAARILHARPADYLFRILIPNLLPDLLGTLSVLFANALAAYATAYALVTNSYPMLALQITSKYKGDVTIDKATGGALAVVMILLMVAATCISNALTKRSAKGRNLV